MTKPWWQLYLEGRAEERAGVQGGAPPEFVGFMGITPAGWDPDGHVRFGWEPPATTRTPGGWVQGGFQAVVLDMAQTFAIFTLMPELTGPMTLEIKVSYIAPAFADRYAVTARPVRVGKTAAHAEGEIHDEAGKLIATSTSTHVIRKFG
jgi:acyl-CoA thioesterase